MGVLEARAWAKDLRDELCARNREWARGKLHVESYGDPPVVVYAPEHPGDEDLSPGTPPEHPSDEDLSPGTPPEHPSEEDEGAFAERHGNFFEPAYRAILQKKEWLRRFDKVHAQAARNLPKPPDLKRRWRELDSSTSSDALLMNVFCTPGALAVRQTLGVDSSELPEFGWRAKVPLKNGRFDRTEVDMRWGGLLVEAKLTENDFQCCRPEVVEAYRDFDAVFEAELLPVVEIPVARKRESAEFPEEYTQEEVIVPAEEWVPTRIEKPRETVTGYASYQLIRNVLAAEATGASFCVIHDERRPDLREAWFEVMQAVRHAELRVRLKVLTWQELAAVLPEGLREFLGAKYGIG